MPSTINSDSGASSGSAGLKFTAADDGILEIQNSGNTAISVGATGVTTFNSPIVQTLPLLSMTFATQTVSSGVATKLINETLDVDNYSWWDASNHRWIPQIPGWYEVYLSLVGGGTTNVTLILPRIYINGAAYAFGLNRVNTSQVSLGMSISTFYQFNGTTDYVEAYGQIYGSGTITAANGTIFNAKLLQRD